PSREGEPQRSQARTLEAHLAGVGHGPPEARGVETLDATPAPARQHALESGVAGPDDDLALARYGAQKMMKLGLDRGEIREDVGMIVFEIVEDQRRRTV